jgi:cytochrome c oxidase cbb3-type subunit 3
MSDFFSPGWSVYIAAATSRGQASTTEDSTGHVWDDDLRELNNPMPRWWMILFIVTIVFSVFYLLLYPGLGSAKGVLDWSSANAYQAEQRKSAADLAVVYSTYATTSAADLSHDPKAMAIGERLFINNCAACHGSDARGSKGFPNLTDNDWLHGGTPEDIVETITHGRVGTMPPMAAAVGDATQVSNVANYVLSLSGSPHDAAAAEAGKAKFVTCAACHGPDGKGNTAIGSANLTDSTWLHGFGKDAIVAMVDNGKTNVMPAQEKRLSPQQIHVLGAYVWSLSQPHPAAVPVASK